MELTISNINSQVTELLEQQFKTFVESDVKSVKLPRAGIKELKQIASKYNFIDNDDYDTNGYQIDFWIGLEHPIKGKCTLSGDLWYSQNFDLYVKAN